MDKNISTSKNLDVVKIATLGPEGTSSESAAVAFANNKNRQSSILLYESFEDAASAVKDGLAEYLIVPGAYSHAGKFFFDPNLKLADSFIFSTAVYGLAVQSNANIPIKPTIGKW